MRERPAAGLLPVAALPPASVYSVIDQVYANNTSKTPQSDVLRVVVNLTRQASGWKVSNVTVLEGASPT
ncbi:MAG: hypothetical protein WB765_17595 [Acidimicrobiales bacterium]